MGFRYTNRFLKSYAQLDKPSQKAIEKSLRRLLEDASHPSLRLRKMKGYHNPNVWEASGNMDLRITFEIPHPDMYILRNCGHHDFLKKNP